MRIPALAAGFSALLAAPAVAEEVTYLFNGQTFTGYYAAAENPQGLVLIVHDWDGMDGYEKRRADMVAGLGYDAFALDMFGEGTSVETVDDRRAATSALNMDRERMRALISAGLEQARAQSDAEGLVVMGYCFGGGVALEMARSEMAGEANGYASFHGSLSTPEGQGWSGDAPPVLVMHGGADRSVTLEDVAELIAQLEAAGTTYTAEIYSNAPHGFTEWESDRYQQRADEESWKAFTDFLAERLG